MGRAAATDRNLYVNDVVYNGTDTGKNATLMGNGAKTFAVSGGTPPSVSAFGDHGSLQIWCKPARIPSVETPSRSAAATQPRSLSARG